MPLSFLKVPAPIHRMARALRLDADWQLVVAAGVVGIVVGALALGFILPIRAIEAALEHAIVASRTEGAMLVVIAPVLGAIGTAAVYALIPMSFRGHGVTQVLYAVNRTRSRIPLRVAVRQWLASTCTISSGGSAGPEGPIVTIGATLGSNAARLLGASDAAATTTLLGCGAAAGLSAVFAAPLTGIFFVGEVVLRDFSSRTFAPIVVASVLSFATVQSIMGHTDPIFGTSTAEMSKVVANTTIGAVPAFVLLALVCAVGAVFFMRSLEFTERGFARLRVPRVLLPVLGARPLPGHGQRPELRRRRDRLRHVPGAAQRRHAQRAHLPGARWALPGDGLRRAAVAARHRRTVRPQRWIGAARTTACCGCSPSQVTPPLLRS